MQKILIFIFISTISTTFGVINNSKRNGHGIFHGLEKEDGKTAWLKEKVEQQTNKNEIGIATAPGVSIVEDNRNSLLDNTDAKHSSLYLQPEPRGLQYLLNTGDFNPYVVHGMKRRDTRNILKGTNCDETILCILRQKRQLGHQPGYQVVPNSNGQAVLYGVPMPNNQFPGNNNFNPQTYPGNVIPSNIVGQQYPYNNQHTGGYRTYGY